MSRPSVEFTDYRKFKREKIDGKVDGLYQRVISQDEKGKDMVRIMEFEPGTDTTPNGIQVHDYWEEVFIMDGSFIDITLDKEFSKGMIASRPPGMEHGPWKSPNGCILYEVRYYK